MDIITYALLKNKIESVENEVKDKQAVIDAGLSPIISSEDGVVTNNFSDEAWEIVVNNDADVYANIDNVLKKCNVSYNSNDNVVTFTDNLNNTVCEITRNSIDDYSVTFGSGFTNVGISVAEKGVVNLQIDNTLTKQGMAADAKVVGDRINEIVEQNNINEPNLYKIFQRVGVIGDSISVGCTEPVGNDPWVVRNLLYSWVKQIGRDAGVPWLNFGTSGQQTLTWCSNETYGKVQMEANGNKCQAYIIGLGCNDEWQTENHVDLGTTADIVDDPDVVATTYYGGYNRIIQLLKRRNPRCKIFCLTNPVGAESPNTSYNDAVRYIATQHYTVTDNVFLVELANDNKTLFTSQTTIAGKDRLGVHYTPVGYRAIANIIETMLHDVIKENQLYFQDVGSIPYDTATPTANTMTE